MEEITIPDSVKELSVPYYTYNGIFSGCTSLKKAVVGKNVKTLPKGLFYDCSALEKILIPEKVSEIGNQVFYNHKDSLSIFGYQNTYAQTYANENNIPFVAVQEFEDKETGITMIDATSVDAKLEVTILPEDSLEVDERTQIL